MTTARSPLALLLALLVLSATAAAVATPRDQPDTTPPVRVFVGETIDVSAVGLTGGGSIGSDSVTLIGVGGDAEGRSETFSDPTDADFGGFEPGSYDATADDDERPEFVVNEPRVTSVVITNQNGANVTNAWEPTGESLTVTAEYSFDEADRLDLTVESPDGLDVTESVASGDRITTSGGSVTVDLSEQDEGTFRFTVEGSDLDRAKQTVTVRTGPRRTATDTPLPTATETVTPTPIKTDTPTVTEEPTATPTDTATPSPTPATTATAPPTTAPPTTAPEATTSTSTPGFGVSAALAALVVVVVITSRQYRP